MAQAMAAAAAHSIPPFPLPALPRIRPPPIPRGTPGLNTLPMPTGGPPTKDSVWADGKWVPPYYNAAKHRSKVISKQLEKAMRHEVHGMNIYAYRHVQTNQVIYSLTKNMDNTIAMKQMLFHGKKTVPSALRRDHWRPYFSVHFPQTPDGAAVGLCAYKDLRELSLRRQLDPPKELKVTTSRDLDRFIRKFGPNFKLAIQRPRGVIGAKYMGHDLPVPGKKVPQYILAKRLMNQKASSVADLSAVLTRRAPEAWWTPEVKRKVLARPVGRAPVDRPRDTESDQTLAIRNPAKASSAPILENERVWRRNEQKEQKEPKERTDQEKQEEEDERQSILTGLTTRREQQIAAKERALLSLPDRAFHRIKAIRKHELEKREEIASRRVYLQQHPGQVSLDKHTLARLSMEYDGSIGHPGRDQTALKELDDTDVLGESSVNLQKILEQMKAEQHLKRSEIETQEVVRIDRELAAKSAEERQQISDATEAERQQITQVIETEINQTRDMLKEYKAEASKYREKYGYKRSPQHNRFVRETTQYLLERKAYLMQDLTKWCGPYAEISAQVNKAMADISDAYDARIVQAKQEIEDARKENSGRNQGDIVVCWADSRNGWHAPSWPQNVVHKELENKAVVLTKNLAVRQHAYFDEDEEWVDEQSAIVDLPSSSSVHVFGGAATNPDKSRYKSPEDLDTQFKELRDRRIEEHVRTSTVQVRDKIVALQLLKDKLMDSLEYGNQNLKAAMESHRDYDLNIYGDAEDADAQSVDDVAISLAESEDNDLKDKHWLRDNFIPWCETKGFKMLQDRLARISPDGSESEPNLVEDTDASIRAKQVRLQLFDVRLELAKSRLSNPARTLPRLQARNNLTNLFKDRARMSEVYAEAEDWLERERSSASATSDVDQPPGPDDATRPRGVDDLTKFDRQYPYIRNAIQQRANNPIPERIDVTYDNIDVTTDNVLDLSYEAQLNTLNESIMTLHQQFETAHRIEGFEEQLRSELYSLKQERLQLMFENEPAFDPEAWRIYREKEDASVEDKIQGSVKERVRARPARKEQTAVKTPEVAAPSGIFDRLKGLFTKKQ